MLHEDEIKLLVTKYTDAHVTGSTKNDIIRDKQNMLE